MRATLFEHFQLKQLAEGDRISHPPWDGSYRRASGAEGRGGWLERARPRFQLICPFLRLSSFTKQEFPEALVNVGE